MKQCTKCGIEKPEDAFEMQPSRGRLRAACRECRRAEQKAWMAKRKLNPPPPTSEIKQCSHCHEIKPISEFSPRAPGYFHGRCKACISLLHQKKRKEQYQNDPNGRFYWPFTNEAGIMVKRCTYCHAEKPLSDYYINGVGHGRHGKCKDCDKAIKKTEYAANPVKYRASVHSSALRYPDRVQARHRRWASANRERLRYKREIRAPYYRLYRTTHRYEFSERTQRRRARLMGAPRVEKIDRKALIERDKWTCYLCGKICTPKSVSLDHVIPLFHGGSHIADNLRVACLTCNSSKGAKHLRDFLP